MRLIALSCLVVAALCAPASAGFVSAAVIDDFSGLDDPSSSAGLGFNRSSQGGALIATGSAFMHGASGFQYLLDSPGFDASAYSGFSLKVDGSLGTGGLFLSVIGADFAFVALDVDFGSTISNGYAWITFDQLDAAVGNTRNQCELAQWLLWLRWDRHLHDWRLSHQRR